MSEGVKTPEKSAAPPLIPQAHGGALLAGGTPGNRGGQPGRSGRRPDWIDEACARGFSEGLPFLRRVVRGKEPGATIADRMKAFDLLGKYRGTVGAADVRMRVRSTVAVVRRHCPADLAKVIVAELQEAWTAPRRRAPTAGEARESG
jgi:hypothetical protein